MRASRGRVPPGLSSSQLEHSGKCVLGLFVYSFGRQVSPMLVYTSACICISVRGHACALQSDRVRSIVNIQEEEEEEEVGGGGEEVGGGCSPFAECDAEGQARGPADVNAGAGPPLRKISMISSFHWNETRDQSC